MSNMTEQRRFTVHPDIIFSLIHSQSGTLGKALMELIMNSIDAGATYVNLTLDGKAFHVVDNGRGFQGREEIERFFETFGTPHTKGDARFGKYRMGRGQIMSFAKTQWRTGEFFMDVDIKHKGLDYLFQEGLESVAGCDIQGEFYSKMLPSELDAVIRELKDLVAYAEIPVNLNGDVINQLPAEMKWDVVTDDAYIKFRQTGDLVVYNLGVKVRGYPQYEFGCSGIVVSRAQLEVNFARNDVLVNQCEVWKRIRKHLKSVSIESNKRKKTLTDDERTNLVRELLFGEMEYYDAKELKLITDTQGKHHSVESLAICGRPVTVEPEKGSRLAEAVHIQKLAFVLAPVTLERFDVQTVAELKAKLIELTGDSHYSHWFRHMQVQDDFDEFKKVMNDGYQTLKDAELTKDERRILKAIRAVQNSLAYGAGNALRKSGHTDEPYPIDPRRILVGVSDTAMMWTDGKKYIVIERRYLKLLRKGFSGAISLIMNLMHEYAHDEVDMSGHDHDMDFYQRYHDMVSHPENDALGGAARHMIAYYVRYLRQDGQRIPQALVQLEDLAARGEEDVSETTEEPEA